MNIAIFTDTYLPQINGVVTSTVAFMSELEKRGHKITILCPKVEGATESTDNVWRFSSLKFPFQPEYRITLPLSKKLLELRKQNIDIIHAQTPFAMGYTAQFFGKLLKIPVVHTYHTFFAEYIHYIPLASKDMLKNWAKYESKRFCNHCAHLIVPSDPMKDKLIEYGITAPIDVIPTGINMNYTTNLESIGAFKLSHGIPSDKRILTYVGRLAQEKNVAFLLESFQRIHQALPNTFLVIIGGGPEQVAMEAQAQTLGIQNAVKFLGYLPYESVFSGLQAAELLLFPSKTETQGLTLLESLAVGTPAVCIDAMGVKDILKNNQGGFLAQDSIDDYSQKAIDILTDTSLHMSKVREALARASEYSIEKMTDKLESLYVSTIQKGVK